MKTPFDDVFEQQGFSETEKDLFMKCLEMARAEQLEGKEATSDIIKAVREVLAQ